MSKTKMIYVVYVRMPLMGSVVLATSQETNVLYVSIRSDFTSGKVRLMNQISIRHLLAYLSHALYNPMDREDAEE